MDATATDTVLSPDLTITKTGSGTVNSTDGVYFTITVSNTGAGAAYDVNVSDALPTAAGVTWTGVTTSGVFPTATLSSNSVSDDLGTLNAGDSVTFVVSGTTTAGTSRDPEQHGHGDLDE